MVVIAEFRGKRAMGRTCGLLVPRNIPLMENTPQRIPQVRLAEGVNVPSGFPAQVAAFTVPANTKARLLLDQSQLTTAYPELIVSGGGKGARAELGYAEAMFVKGARRGDKGNRNEIAGKEFLGYDDIFTSDGGQRRMYRPLWWRTFRYIEVKIETKDEPLVIEDLRSVYSGYPFERKAKFAGGSELLTPDSGCWLAHGAVVCARDLHGLSLLRAVAIRG
jgi:alpha-L-rhamnosidase